MPQDVKSVRFWVACVRILPFLLFLLWALNGIIALKSSHAPMFNWLFLAGMVLLAVASVAAWVVKPSWR
jgi:hypothetical protein